MACEPASDEKERKTERDEVMTLYQITINGAPFSDPVDINLRNRILQSLDGVVDNVKCEEVQEKPQLRLVEGGRK